MMERMTISLDELDRACKEIELEAAKKIWGMDGMNEATRTYAMFKVVHGLMEHIGLSLRHPVNVEEFLGTLERSGIETTYGVPSNQWTEEMLAKLR